MNRLRQWLAPAVEALREYWVPFLVIQLSGVAFVLAYYYVPLVRDSCEQVARWKSQAGWLFTIGGGVLSGGVLPALARMAVGRFGPVTAAKLREVFYLCLVFGTLGLLVDLQYRLQVLLFGAGHECGTLLVKVALDQFFVTPFISTPFFVTLCLWREKQFRLDATLSEWGKGLYSRRVVPILLPGWMYWVPMVFCIYALPTPLQFPFWVCVVTAWNLIAIFIVNDTADDKGRERMETCAVSGSD